MGFSTQDRPTGAVSVVVVVVVVLAVPSTQLLKKRAWLLHLTSDKAPLAARDSTEIACALC